MDLYLKFKDEAEALVVLCTEKLDSEGNTTLEPKFSNIDTVGVIYDTTDPDNPIAKSGWHVNVRLVEGESDKSLSKYKTAPATPYRVWG